MLKSSPHPKVSPAIPPSSLPLSNSLRARVRLTVGGGRGHERQRGTAPAVAPPRHSCPRRALAPPPPLQFSARTRYVNCGGGRGHERQRGTTPAVALPRHSCPRRALAPPPPPPLQFSARTRYVKLGGARRAPAAWTAAHPRGQTQRLQTCTRMLAAIAARLLAALP